MKAMGVMDGINMGITDLSDGGKIFTICPSRKERERSKRK